MSGQALHFTNEPIPHSRKVRYIESEIDVQPKLDTWINESQTIRPRM